MRILELRQEQGIDDLAVGGPGDLHRDLGPHAPHEIALHLAEPVEVAIVGQGDPRTGEGEGMDILRRNDGVRAVVHAPNMGDHATRRDLLRERLQVAVDDRLEGRVQLGARLGDRVPEFGLEFDLSDLSCIGLVTTAEVVE